MTSLTSIIENEFTNYSKDDEQQDLNIKIYKKHNNYCINCCKYQENLCKYKYNINRCINAITSIGIINLNIADVQLSEAFKNKYAISNVKEKHKHKNNNYKIKSIVINQFNTKNDGANYNMAIYNDIVTKKIKVLLICRKNSVGYIDLIRGKYNELNSENLIYLLNQMTPNELNNIKNMDYNELWHDLWNGKYDYIVDDINNSKIENKNKNNNYIDLTYNIYDKNIICVNNNNDAKMYKEYLMGLYKYTYIITNNKIADIVDTIKCIYNEPEWGFPKGKRNQYETNLECALREFTEETTINTKELTILDRLVPITETFIGTNNINYKHTYYIGIGSQIQPNINDYKQSIEIGNIGWFSIEQAKKLIRSYHTDRLEILNMIEKFISHNIRYYMTYNK